MTSLHQQLVNFYLLIITIQFMGISQSLSMSADNFFFSSPEQNPKSKLQRETRKQGGRKRRGGRRAVKGRGSDSKPHSCPPARQHGVTELANTLNQKMHLPCKTKFLAFTSWWQHGVSLLLWKSPNPPKLPVAQRHDAISQTRKNNLFFFYYFSYSPTLSLD